MSCTARAVLRLLAPLAGVTAERLSISVDAMKHRPPPPIPIDRRIVDALAEESSAIPSHGDIEVVEQRVQEVMQGLVALVRTTPNIPTAARIVALLHALSPSPPPLPLLPLQPLVRRLRKLLLLPPAPMPVDCLSSMHLLPDNAMPNVLATLRYASWSAQDAKRIARFPFGAASALAAGVVHEAVRDAVLADPKAIVYTLTEGYADPQLIAKVASNAQAAAEVLVARPDFAQHAALVAQAASYPDTAAQVLIGIPALRTHPALLAGVKRSSYHVAEVLAACPEFARDPSFLAAAALDCAAAAKVLCHCPRTEAESQLIDAVAWPSDAASVLIARSDLRAHPALLTVLKREITNRRTRFLSEESVLTSQAAAKVLISEASLRTDADLVELARRNSETAAEVLIGCPDIRDARFITAACKTSETAAAVLIGCPDLRRRKALITAVAKKPEMATKVLIACADIADDRLIGTVARFPLYAADILLHRPDLRTNRTLLAAVSWRPDTSAQIWIRYPDVCDEEVTRAFTQSVIRHPESAAAVLRARHDVRDPRLLAAVASKPDLLEQVLAERPDLRAVLAPSLPFTDNAT